MAAVVLGFRHLEPVVFKSRLPRRIKKARRIPRSPLTRIDVTREEYNRIIEILNERGDIINDLRAQLEIQFKRMAQLQADVDLVKRRERT